MSAKTIAIKGILYTSFGGVLGQILQFFTKLFLARLLLPEDFGLMAIILSITNIINIFFSLGWGDELIQRRNNFDRAINTLFVFFLSSSILIFLSVFFLSPLLSTFFKISQLNYLIKIYSFSFIMYCLNMIYNIYAQKNLLFKKKVLCEITSIIIFSILSILLAKLNFGVWSLLIAQLTQSIALTFLLILSINWRPSFIFDQTILKEIWSFVKHSSIGHVLGIGILYIDNLFVASFLGTEQLGYYVMSFSLASIPIIAITHSISGVMFPIFSKVKDKIELKNIFLKTLHLNFFILLPIYSFGFILANYLINIIFSEKWTPIIPIFQLLLIYSALRSFCNIVINLVLSEGKPQIIKKIFIIEFTSLILFVIPGLIFFKIYGVVLAVILARFISSLMFFLYIRRMLCITFTDHIKNIITTLQITLFTALLLVILKRALFFDITFINLICLLFFAIISWGLLTLLFDKKSMKEIQYLIESFKKKIVNKYDDVRINKFMHHLKKLKKDLMN